LYKALTLPEVFSGISEKTIQIKQSLSKNTSDQYLQKLVEYMNDKKPYLNPALTLIDLAEEVSIPPRSLSEVINSSLKQNFYDFINTYRIEESKRLLSISTEQSKTVLEILYKVGFNNKSSFNSAFKKCTGITPSQFRKLYLN
jgi:AraC-like DNA-binding protein